MRALGFLGCFLAILGFGTQGVFVKSEAIRKAGVHPFLVVELFSFFIGLIGVITAGTSAVVGFPFWESLLPGTHSKRYTDALFACLVYAPGNVLLLWACRRIGVGLAIGIVSACATLTSFLLGLIFVAGTQSEINLVYCIPAIAMIIFAAALMSATKIPAFKQLVDPTSGSPSPPVTTEEPSVIGGQQYGKPSRLGNPLLETLGEESSCGNSQNLRFHRWQSDPGITLEEDLLPRQMSQDDDATSARSSVLYESIGAGSLLVSRKALARTKTIKWGTLNIQAFLVAGIKVRDKLPQEARLSMLQSRGSSIAEDDFEGGHLEDVDAFSTVVYGALDLFGVSVALVSGVFIGSQGIFWAQDASLDGLANSLAAFMVGQFLVTTFLLLPLFIRAPQTLIKNHVALASPYAFAGACCFSIALTGQLLGLINLAESIAMPLTQLNLIIAGLWGVFFFGEVSSSRLVAVFFLAMVIDIAAALLLNLGYTG